MTEHIETASALHVAWRKSTYSGHQNNCVEVALQEHAAFVRDSKDPDGPALLFSAAAFAAFVGAVSNGEFDV